MALATSSPAASKAHWTRATKADVHTIALDSLRIFPVKAPDLPQLSSIDSNAYPIVSKDRFAVGPTRQVDDRRSHYSTDYRLR
ncbi:hypothetical protein XAP6984_250034 [Xanthomonas phaseoli pv. phaseoli]|uniref:Uncharacterized protein n=1 Tax=Xanthomonas campestris pv. phaseoli TaxID=317013 RepID=A0ABY1TRN0_XANCH|nr:hypothetical protein XAP6984_250034 [Xanthomonas phaseoli pv. phaseoli]